MVCIVCMYVHVYIIWYSELTIGVGMVPVGEEMVESFLRGKGGVAMGVANS